MKLHVCTGQPDCFACKLRSVQFGGARSQERRESLHTSREFETAMAKDMPAYKRLRADGLQPQGITGAAIVEQSDDHHVIEGTPKLAEYADEILFNRVPTREERGLAP